ncbi:unnamed protein product [Prorocentrum cordatum]|uniref:Uncharacterized protein n=1 Tax=Prorocentrum cordatum TaxID=2364126 RepID=A0ABN9RXN4_9DINO|nr:unnamed protein product [Polarella glacialis]
MFNNNDLILEQQQQQQAMRGHVRGGPLPSPPSLFPFSPPPPPPPPDLFTGEFRGGSSLGCETARGGPNGASSFQPWPGPKILPGGCRPGISICSELRGCADFLLLVVRCPASGSGYAGIGDGPDRPQRHGAVLSQEAVERPGGLRARIANWAKRSSAVDQTRVWTLGSLDHRWKAVCFLFVGVPRVVICCLLANSGARFIVRSPDIIVDTVAVLFVVDVAAFMYSAFTTNAVKQQLEMVQPLECYPCNTRRLVSFLFVNFAYPVLLVCFSVAVVWCSREGCRKSEDFEARPHTMSFMLGSQMFVQQCTTSLDVIQSKSVWIVWR